MLERNESLRAAMAEARCSYEGLARRVNGLGREHGIELMYDKSSVSHWIKGHRPRGRVPFLVAEVLSRQLDRPVSLAEIGLGTDAKKDVVVSSMAFQESRAVAFEVMTELGRVDMDRRDFLYLLGFSAAGFTGAQRDWLLHVLTVPESPAVRVSSRHVRGLIEMEQFFTDIDNKLGGGYARSTLVSYLANEAVPLLRRDGPEEVKQELFAMVGQLFLSAGWMTYDDGAFGLAQRYFTQGLYLAREAGARGLAVGGQILSASSHLATFCGDPKEGLALARGAVHTAEKSDSEAALMRAHLMEARANAELGDERAATAAMLHAEQAEERRKPAEEAPWNAYQNQYFLANHMSVCFRELNNADRMLEFAERSMTPELGRRNAMNSVHIARARLRLGDLEEAGRAGVESAAAVGGLRSNLARTAITDFIAELRTYADTPQVSGSIGEIDRILRSSTHTV